MLISPTDVRIDFMYRGAHSGSLNASPVAETARPPASKSFALWSVLVGIYASIWGSFVAIAGIAFIRGRIASGYSLEPGPFVIVVAILVVPGLLMLISGIWLIWRARWARWIALVSTIVDVLVSLGLGDGVGTIVDLGLIVVLLVALVNELNRPAAV